MKEKAVPSEISNPEIVLIDARNEIYYATGSDRTNENRLYQIRSGTFPQNVCSCSPQSINVSLELCILHQELCALKTHTSRLSSGHLMLDFKDGVFWVFSKRPFEPVKE